MLIARLSDLHVRPKGVLYQGVVDSNRMLSEAIRHVQALDRRPDLVLLTGDVVDQGHMDEYSMARELLADLSIPFLVIPGNHDHREKFRTAFSDHAYLPTQGAIHYCIDAFPVRIVALDVCVPGQHHGEVSAASLDWLRSVFESNRDKPTLLMMHQPPFISGIPYMDEYRCREPEALASLLSQFDNIEAVLCGHVHRSMSRRWAGTVVHSCPSTTTEIALQLDPHAAPRSYAGPPGYMLHLWNQAQGVLSHTIHLGDFPGPYPFA